MRLAIREDSREIIDYIGKRECHILPDWLLVYIIEDERLVLYTTGNIRIGLIENSACLKGFWYYSDQGSFLLVQFVYHGKPRMEIMYLQTD